MTNGNEGHLKTTQFVIWMIAFLGLTLGFFYWAYGTLDKKIDTAQTHMELIDTTHINGFDRITKLETNWENLKSVPSDIGKLKTSIALICQALRIKCE